MPIRITDAVALDIRFPYSIEMKPSSLADHAYPDGPVWTAIRERG